MPKGNSSLSVSKTAAGWLLIPLDDSFQLAMEGNDDYYTSVIPLPVALIFMELPYTEFTSTTTAMFPLAILTAPFTPSGFPVNDFPMLAPFGQI